MRVYNGTIISKKERELIDFLQTGSSDWSQAFYQYKQRRKAKFFPSKNRSWFNTTLKKLKAKGLFTEVPFVLNGLEWFNPGIKGSKANFTAITKQNDFQEHREVLKKII